MRFLNKGFTLLELMVATAILVFVITGLLATLVYCILLNETNNNLVIAANDAQYVLEQMKTLAYDELDDYAPQQFTNLPNETIADPQVNEIKSGIKEITLNVSWLERKRQRNFSLSSRVSK